MTDREMIIKGLYQHCEGSMFDRCGECPYYEVADEPFRCRDALLMDTLALLREQEPVKPELRMSRHGFRQWIVCGNCYGNMRGLYDYCPWCGRKIKWNNKENKDGT